MTLSHCWGTVEILKRQRQNLKSFYDLIPFDALPKTFKDAIEVTKSLRTRYLWIDSLCIIQDSTDDWQKEAAVMHLLYQNAYCNIAATGAKDGSYGCFFERNPNTFNATVVRLLWKMAESKLFAVVQQTRILQKRISDSPLLRRAWVLQERLLAQRVVHFVQDQVFFECREHLMCGLYPHGIPDSHSDYCVKC
jgi:hypothetical protein